MDHVLIIPHRRARGMRGVYRVRDVARRRTLPVVKAAVDSAVLR